MPSVSVQFGVELVEKPLRPRPTYAGFTDLSAFREIEALGFPANHIATPPRIDIKADETDPRVATVLAIVAKYGFTPSPHLLTNWKTTDCGEFIMGRRRTFTDAEIENARLLCLVPKGPFQQFADYCYPWVNGVHGGQFGPAERLRYARESMGDDESGWRIKANARLKKSTQIGSLGVLSVFLVGPLLKKQLEAADLHGLKLTPVRYDRPDKAARQLWQFGNSAKMPNCLIPRLTQGGEEPIPKRENDGAVWDDGGYWPPVLAFARAEADSLLPIDAAVTQEKIGQHGAFLHREVIVSQRFRKILLQNRIHNVGYVPVSVVE